VLSVGRVWATYAMCGQLLIWHLSPVGRVRVIVPACDVRVGFSLYGRTDVSCALEVALVMTCRGVPRWIRVHEGWVCWVVVAGLWVCVLICELDLGTQLVPGLVYKSAGEPCQSLSVRRLQVFTACQEVVGVCQYAVSGGCWSGLAVLQPMLRTCLE
jgi:hypothetical protein